MGLLLMFWLAGGRSVPREVFGKLQVLVLVEQGLCSVCRESRGTVAVGLAPGVVLVATQCIPLVSRPARGARQAPWPRSVERGWQGAAAHPNPAWLPARLLCGAKSGELPPIQKGAWPHLIPARDNSSTG